MNMEQAILEELATRYDISSLRARVPKEVGREVHGFSPQVIRADGWRLSMAEELRDGDDRPIARVVFDAIEEPAERVLVDVVECPTSRDALDALLERLAGNQLASLPEGPADLGFAAYEHPEGAPPAVFFARDNLCVTVASFGSRSTPVRVWADRVVRAFEDFGRPESP